MQVRTRSRMSFCVQLLSTLVPSAAHSARSSVSTAGSTAGSSGKAVAAAGVAAAAAPQSLSSTPMALHASTEYLPADCFRTAPATASRST